MRTLHHLLWAGALAYVATLYAPNGLETFRATMATITQALEAR